MSDSHVTIAEAADLEKISYDAMRLKISRNAEKFMVKKEKRKSGGKDVILVALSSLSPKAKKAWSEQKKLKELAGAVQLEKESMQETPWYVNEDIEWFQEHHKSAWYKAMELGNIVREFLEYSEKGRTEYADTFAQERIGKGQRTLYRYVKAYQEASAWAHKLHKQDGANYEYLKVLALCRKPKESGNFPSFSPEVKQCIKNIWFNEDFSESQNTKEKLYDDLQKIANINKWERIPSYQSVARYIRYLMEEKGMNNAKFLAQEGERAWKNKVMGKAIRDTTVLQPMEVVMGDEHTFDCWVAYTHPNGKVVPIRPVLVAWIDVRSRMILGDVICHHANSEILKESLIKLINTPGCGVPQYLLIDNGKDYTAEIMTGVPRNQRNFENTDYTDLANGFYRMIGIERVHRALPYQPWTKGQVERFFGGVCERFTKQFTSYTGTLTGSRTDAKISKDIQKMCDRGELLTMEEFYAEWEKWLKEKYEIKNHGGLTRAGEQYKKPRDLFENEEHYFKPAPPKSAQLIMMYKEDNVRIYNYGFRRYGKIYDHPDLRVHIDEKLSIRYDKNDISIMFVIDKKGRKICEAECQELLAFGEHVSEEALKNHMLNQNRQLKADKKILADARIPFEEMNDQYVGFSSSVGGVDLMIGHKPEKKSNNKVVAMPLDKGYRGGLRGKSDEPQEDNEYINRQAEDALKALRAL